MISEVKCDIRERIWGYVLYTDTVTDAAIWSEKIDLRASAVDNALSIVHRLHVNK